MEIYSFQERHYDQQIDSEQSYLLVADIGGTNSNFGILRQVDGNFTLVLSLHLKSHKIEQFTSVVVDLLKYLEQKYELTFAQMAIGSAGVIEQARSISKPTNLTFTIDTRDIIKATGLKKIVLLNDFEAVGYGIDKIDSQNLVVIKDGMPRAHANKVIVGAGTGLGKGIMCFDDHLQRYLPIASEGGHADFAAQNQKELDLIDFIRKTEKISSAISWEDILSGRGIKRIYSFLRSINNYKKTDIAQQIEQNGMHPDAIFSHKHDDPSCGDTFDWYAMFYARVAKNFALEALALSGVFIAGGIASKNLDLFERDSFAKEFINCGKQQELLRDVPVTVVADYNVSLYGAAAYLLMSQ